MLPLEGNDLLQSIQSQWLAWEAVLKVPSYCAYETIETAGVMVVTMSSATALCNRLPVPITADHIGIVKPRDRSDPIYSRFASALRQSLSQQTETTLGAQNSISGIVFDDDGPLEGVQVTISRGETKASTNTDGVGHFSLSLEHSSRAEVRLIARKDNYKIKNVTTELGHPDFDFKMEKEKLK
jgi:hypothetical protein